MGGGRVGCVGWRGYQRFTCLPTHVTQVRRLASLAAVHHAGVLENRCTAFGFASHVTPFSLTTTNTYLPSSLSINPSALLDHCHLPFPCSLPPPHTRSPLAPTTLRVFTSGVCGVEIEKQLTSRGGGCGWMVPVHYKCSVGYVLYPRAIF